MPYKKLTILILALACFGIWSKKAYANVIIGRSLYFGLVEGLVGVWIFVIKNSALMRGVFGVDPARFALASLRVDGKILLHKLQARIHEISI